jgi:hypothetical protein
MTSVGRGIATSMLLTTPKMRPKNHIGFCSVDLLRFSIDSVIFRSFFAVVSSNGLLK